jgi:hypothetical protein
VQQRLPFDPYHPQELPEAQARCSPSLGNSLDKPASHATEWIGGVALHLDGSDSIVLSSRLNRALRPRTNVESSYPFSSSNKTFEGTIEDRHHGHARFRWQRPSSRLRHPSCHGRITSPFNLLVCDSIFEEEIWDQLWKRLSEASNLSIPD